MVAWNPSFLLVEHSHPSDTWRSPVEHEGGALAINPTPAGEFEFATEYDPQLGCRYQYLASPGDDA